MYRLRLILFILLAAFNVNSQFKYWEEMTQDEKSEILSSPSLNSNAYCYYWGTFTPSDDSLTFSMLDTITSTFEPFYFFVFNKILLLSDGALAEIMGNYCFKIFRLFPEPLVNYFAEFPESIEEIYNTYIFMIGEELFYDRNEREEFSRLKILFSGFNPVFDKFVNDIETEELRLKSKDNGR